MTASEPPLRELFIEQEEDEEDESYPPSWRDPITGELRILTEKCSTCIFRPGNLMNLNEGRLQDMTDSTDAGDTNVICHQSLGRKVGDMCRGSYDRRPGQLARIAERLGFIKWVEPQPQEKP